MTITRIQAPCVVNATGAASRVVKMAKKRTVEPEEVFIVEGTFWYSDENESHVFCLPLFASNFADANAKAEKITTGFGPGLVEISSVRKHRKL